MRKTPVAATATMLLVAVLGIFTPAQSAAATSAPAGGPGVAFDDNWPTSPRG